MVLKGVKLLLTNPYYPSRPAHSSSIHVMLGLKHNQKLPEEGMPEQVIQGVRIWVEPLRGDPYIRRRRHHRVRAACPLCNETMSAGRLNQHAKIHADPL